MAILNAFRQRLATWALATVLVFGVSACGGSEEPTATPPPRRTDSHHCASGTNRHAGTTHRHPRTSHAGGGCRAGEGVLCQSVQRHDL